MTEHAAPEPSVEALRSATSGPAPPVTPTETSAAPAGDADAAPAEPETALGAPPASEETAVASIDAANVKMETRRLDFFYGSNQALRSISIPFARNAVTALI